MLKLTKLEFSSVFLNHIFETLRHQQRVCWIKILGNNTFLLVVLIVHTFLCICVLYVCYLQLIFSVSAPHNLEDFLPLLGKHCSTMYICTVVHCSCVYIMLIIYIRCKNSTIRTYKLSSFYSGVLLLQISILSLQFF